MEASSSDRVSPEGEKAPPTHDVAGMMGHLPESADGGSLSPDNQLDQWYLRQADLAGTSGNWLLAERFERVVRMRQWMLLSMRRENALDRKDLRGSP